MGNPVLGRNSLGTAIKRAEEILEILQQACNRRELLILDTPFLRFESGFLALQEGELLAQATMSREDALYGLRTPELRIRFPHDLGFYEAPVKMLGLELTEGRRALRLSLPRLIQENDQRVAYRAERVGKVTVTYSTPRSEIHTAALVDISSTGARLLAERDLGPGMVEVSSTLQVSIPLATDIQINHGAKVRHLDTRRMGIEFIPPLPRSLAEPLSRWVFMRQEEEKERQARRLEIRDQRPATPDNALAPGGILLITEDPALAEAVGEPLERLRTVHVIPAGIQPLKEALASRPVLAILHLTELSLDRRRRYKAMADLLGTRVPTLFLGTGVEGSLLFELSSEWKAASALSWSPQRATFLERLAQGIIRKHTSGGESPLAPRED